MERSSAQERLYEEFSWRTFPTAPSPTTTPDTQSVSPPLERTSCVQTPTFNCLHGILKTRKPRSGAGGVGESCRYRGETVWVKSYPWRQRQQGTQRQWVVGQHTLKDRDRLALGYQTGQQWVRCGSVVPHQSLTSNAGVPTPARLFPFNLPLQVPNQKISSLLIQVQAIVYDGRDTARYKNMEQDKKNGDARIVQ